jgi:hypothetical protein
MHLRNIYNYTIGVKKCQLLAGLSVGTNINFFQSPSLDNDDVLVINAAHIAIQNKMALNESTTLVFSIAVPTIALAKRLVLDGGLHEPGSDESNVAQILYGDSKIVFANSYAFSAEYGRKLSNTIYWIVAYGFKYIRNGTTEPVELYANELTTGFLFNL